MTLKNRNNIIMVHLVVLLFIAFVYLTPTHFDFLMWNVFLALLPLDFALLVLVARLKISQLIFSALWLLFFPNTMYMITDFIHLQYISTALDVRYQYFNYSVLAAGIFIGVFLGILSLELMMRRYLKNRRGFVALFTLGVVSWISSFGIYLGRFLRLNSWDVFTNFDLVWANIQNSVSKHMFAFVGLFALAQFAILVIYHYGGRLLFVLGEQVLAEERAVKDFSDEKNNLK
ncbi:DUF1361 domain-containing protein [Fructobacillus parabroussonetiae]|uniref:DUF1361 domain-containing protein n=1 Tax=Fructobacillus parabroussonetiae TaxID=2713174 RepID=A0ABS5QYJ1_9LACO|nr:DUF1361 domain-containing protein [Fructobacillus parabroussonetiae]MBS9337700.1 DUF1361 domain-containing protein [Fructobacillus parabroussonetiae]